MDMALAEEGNGMGKRLILYFLNIFHTSNYNNCEKSTVNSTFHVRKWRWRQE
jgi:hypothetical protein